jgi:hypothetical protein
MDHRFFVGNFPRDLGPQIERLREVLDLTAAAATRVVVPNVVGAVDLLDYRKDSHPWNAC